MPLDDTSRRIENEDLWALQQARAKIAAGLWCRGNYIGGDGSRCVINWLAQYSYDSRRIAGEHLSVFVPKRFFRDSTTKGDKVLAVMMYNDLAWFGRWRVLRMLDKAITRM